jgi:hypothetical protein
MALLPMPTQYKVYIVRHVLVNAEHFREYVTRTAVVPEIGRYAAVHWVAVLSCESVVSVPNAEAVAALPLIDVCEMALPSQALSRGRICADASDEPVKSEPIDVDSDEERSVEEWAKEQTRRSPAISGRRERTRSPSLTDCTVREIEPVHELLSLEDVTALTMARARWCRLANTLHVRFHEGAIHVHVTSVSTDANSQNVTGQGECEVEGLILGLWHVQDEELWAVDLDNPTFKVAMQGPHRDKWMDAFQCELSSLRELDTYELAPWPKGQHVIRDKVVCKVKRGADGSIERYKIRYEGCGYDETEGVDYLEHHGRRLGNTPLCVVGLYMRPRLAV